MEELSRTFLGGVRLLRTSKGIQLNQYSEDVFLTDEEVQQFDRQRHITSCWRFLDPSIYAEPMDILVKSNGKAFFNSTQDYLNRGRRQGTTRKCMMMGYIIGALAYHNLQLSNIYFSIANKTSITAEKTGFSAEKLVFSGHEIAYYEFDALIAALRRGYDYLRFVIHEIYSKGRGSCASAFYKEIKSTNIPPNDREVYQKSWETFGEKVTEYRHCIQHYSPVDMGFGASIMEKKGRFWTTSHRIPDNPESRSSKGFKYEKGIDAQSFCYQASIDLKELVDSVIEVYVNDWSGLSETK